MSPKPTGTVYYVTCFLNFGFGEVWLSQGVGDEKLFLAAFKQTIGDTYLQTWHQNINNNRK